MPRKDRRRRKAVKPATERPVKIEMASFGVPPEQHAAFKAAALAAAIEGVAEFPKMLERFGKLFRDRDPMGMIASLAMYSLSGFVTDRGEIKRSSRNIEQHHVELLQAIMMMIPENEWGKRPPSADVMQVVHDEIPKLANTFLFQRMLSDDDHSDETTQVLASLQIGIRLHTQAVRNWGYYTHMIRITKELHQPLDAAFGEKLGFGIVDLVEVLAAVVKEYERRANEHWSTLRKVLQGKTIQRMVQLYYKHVPGLAGDPASLIANFPPGVNRDGVMSFLMQHYDLRLADQATFTPHEIAPLAGRSVEVAEKVLRAVSRLPGDLAGENPDFLFLSNPIWTAPGIDLGDRFFFAIPHVVQSHINAVVRGLAERAELTDALERRRARYLEDRLEAILTAALPSAMIKAGAKWEIEGEQGETDVIAVLDRVVIIAEAKSHRLTPEALRGAPARMKKHVKDLIVDPSLQSGRLEAFIESAAAGNEAAGAVIKTLGIDPATVDRIIRFSLTLDDFSVLSSSEADFKAVGWVPNDHHLAPTIMLADLECIVDILDNPLLLTHYLSERSHFQKAFDLMGDELDFLGLYLDTGFNIAGLEDHGGKFSPTGMSAPVDRYYEGRDAGINVPKPKARLQPYYQAILDRLTDRKPPGWTMAGLHLLSSADPAEQRTIENGVKKLRLMVAKNYRDPEHISSLVVKPPLDRKATVIFYVFPEALRGDLKKNAAQLTAEVLADGRHKSCALFARCLDDWAKPFSAIMLTEN
jgi:hypothetical protein